MGFSLFGRSGDNVTENKTTNVTNDFTTTDSNNQLTKSTVNLAKTKNTSQISNDTRIQNTALQLTDAFNQFTTLNLAGIGNIGGTSADDAAKYASLFKAFPQPNYNGMNTAVPDLSKGLLDFNTLSRIATDNIRASGDVSRGVQEGFAANTRATGDSLSGMIGSATPGVLANPLIWVVVGIVALLGFVLLRRK